MAVSQKDAQKAKKREKNKRVFGLGELKKAQSEWNSKMQLQRETETRRVIL